MKLPLWGNLNSKNKIIAIVIAVMIANVAVIYFLIFPTVNKIKSLRNDILNIKIDSANKITQEKSINDINNKIKMIQPQMEKINAIFINQNREIEFINALEDLAAKYNINQKLNINFNNPEKGETFNKVPVAIDASGNFNNIISYFSALEAMNYYININNISLAAGGSGENIGETGRPFETKNNAANIGLKISGHSFWK